MVTTGSDVNYSLGGAETGTTILGGSTGADSAAHLLTDRCYLSFGGER